MAADRASLMTGYRDLEAWRQDRSLNDRARIGGRPGRGSAVVTRHGDGDLSKGILKLSCEPDEMPGSVAVGTGGDRTRIGLPLTTTPLGGKRVSR